MTNQLDLLLVQDSDVAELCGNGRPHLRPGFVEGTGLAVGALSISQHAFVGRKRAFCGLDQIQHGNVFDSAKQGVASVGAATRFHPRCLNERCHYLGQKVGTGTDSRREIGTLQPGPVGMELANGSQGKFSSPLQDQFHSFTIGNTPGRSPGLPPRPPRASSSDPVGSLHRPASCLRIPMLKTADGVAASMRATSSKVSAS